MKRLSTSTLSRTPHIPIFHSGTISTIKLNLTSGSFKGTEYSYTAKESNLEDFISQIELDPELVITQVPLVLQTLLRIR